MPIVHYSGGRGFGGSLRDKIPEQHLPFAEWLTRVLLIVAVLAGSYFAYARIDRVQKQQACESNMRALTGAILLYIEANNGTYPLADNWSDAVLADVAGSDELLNCPDAEAYGYGYNEGMSGRSSFSFQNTDLVLLFEAKQKQANLSGDLEDIEYRHDVAIFGMTSGETKLRNPEAQPLQWQPK